MLELTDVARLASTQINVSPNLVFEIEGYSKKFGASEISKLIRIGDDDLFIGNDWTIGGYRVIPDQSPYISFSLGTSSRITQQSQPDKGEGTSVSQLVVALVDKNQEISKLVSPGQELSDVFGRNARVSLGFANTDVDVDYVQVFGGIISDIICGPGWVQFVLNNTDDKKRTPLTVESTSELDGDIPDTGISVLTLDNTDAFYNPVLGPDGLYDDDVEFYARIDDEIFRYTGKTSTTLTGVTRAQFGTVAAEHDDGASVQSYIRLKGNGLTMALKIMLSGVQGYYSEDNEITNFNVLDPLNSVGNVLFFSGIDVKSKYGLTEGTYLTITGAANGVNNVSMKQIQDFGFTNDGTFIVVDDVSFVDEINTSAVVSFRSQYDTLPIGLKMLPTEVDVAEHEKIRDQFLSVFEFDFLERSIGEGKEFLEKQIYLPQSCFSVPRKGRSSVAFHVGPIATTKIVTLDTTTVLNADKLQVRRSAAKNFSNRVRYKYNRDYLDDSKFNTTKEFDAALTLLEQVNGMVRVLEIKSDGMRDSTNAEALALQSSRRFLKRYQLGAEYIQNIQVQFGAGYAIEIGDIVAVDYADLQLTDFQTGTRMGDIKLMSVLNKILDNKTGEISVDVVNTIFAQNDRYGLISPSSKAGTGSTTEKIQLQKSWSTKPYQKESNKWRDYIGQEVLVHSPDWSFQEITTIQAFSDDGATMLIDPPLSIGVPSGYIVQPPNYPSSTDANEQYYWKARHVFFAPQLKVVTGISPTQFTVSGPDAATVLENAILRVHNFDYSSDSPEVVVTDVTGNTITVGTSLGFTPNSTYYVDLVGFADGGYAYRYL